MKVGKPGRPSDVEDRRPTPIQIAVREGAARARANDPVQRRAQASARREESMGRKPTQNKRK